MTLAGYPDFHTFAIERSFSRYSMNINFKPTEYQLQSQSSGKIYDDTGWLLDAPGETIPALLRALYKKRSFNPGSNSLGIYKYADWLPIQKTLEGSSAPVTFRSLKLAEKLKLKNLFITFSGYWPEKGANMSTCSFKETEAYSVCARFRNSPGNVLVVASAGNTARAFAKVCSDNQIPLLLCVPSDNIDALWFEKPLNPCVKLVVTEPGSDYFDAIQLSNLAVKCDGFIAEGGAKNVARRDGMGTTVLSAAEFIGRIPDYYFQAVGSGTGAIAAWEANLRLIADGRFGDHKMKLLVSQNAPFLPIYHAWKAGSREMLAYDDDSARLHVEEIEAKVLSNRKPPYPIKGGLYDALINTGGDVLAVTNEEARSANSIFMETEGLDLHPAAAVAMASLIRMAENGELDRSANIMLNITGGGEQKFKAGRALFYLEPSMVFKINTDPDYVKQQLNSLIW
jgi:cysteate synthase